MAYGLRTFDSAGNIYIDTSVRMARIVSIWYLASYNLSDDETSTIYTYDSPVIPGLVNDGTWYVDCPGIMFKYSFIGGNRVRLQFYSAFTSGDAYIHIGRF